jgi:hypothetical protein
MLPCAFPIRNHERLGNFKRKVQIESAHLVYQIQLADLVVLHVSTSTIQSRRKAGHDFDLGMALKTRLQSSVSSRQFLSRLNRRLQSWYVVSS